MDKAIGLIGTESALAWKLAVNILGKGKNSPDAQHTQDKVQQSALVKTLIETCDLRQGAYKKWELGALGSVHSRRSGISGQ